MRTDNTEPHPRHIRLASAALRPPRRSATRRKRHCSRCPHGIFAGLLPRCQTPWVAALLSLVMAASLLPIGSVKILAEMSSFAALVAFLTVNLALITLRYTDPDHPRPFRVAGAIGRMPVLPLAAIASIVLLLIHFDWKIYAAGGVAVVLTAIAYFVRQSLRANVRRARAKTTTLAREVRSKRLQHRSTPGAARPGRVICSLAQPRSCR